MSVKLQRCVAKETKFIAANYKFENDILECLVLEVVGGLRPQLDSSLAVCVYHRIDRNSVFAAALKR